MTIPTHTLTVGDVARMLDVSPDRVRQKDDELEPVRVRGQRRYDPQVIARVMAERAAKVPA